MPFSSTDLIHALPCASQQQQHQQEGFVDPLGVSSVTIDWALPTTTTSADQPHQHGHSDDAAVAAGTTTTRRPMGKALDTSTTSTMMSVNASCGGLSSLGGTSVFLHNDNNNNNNNNNDDELCTIHSAKELLHQRQLQQQSMCSSSFSHQSLHNNTTATTTTNSNDCLPQRPVAAHAVEHQQVFSVLQRLPSCIHDHHHLPSSSHYPHQPQRQDEQRRSSRDHSVSTAKASCTTPDPDFVRVTASHHVEGMFCQDKDEE